MRHLTKGRNAVPRAKIFVGPTRSACVAWPHSTRLNCACVRWLLAATWPQLGQVRLGFCGGTATSHRPIHAIVYAKLAAELRPALIEDGFVQAGLGPNIASRLLGCACCEPRRTRHQFPSTFLADLRFRDRRHEATSCLFTKGLCVMEAARMTGHKSLATL